MNNQKESSKQGNTSPNSRSKLVISPRQSGSIVTSTLIGVGVLTLPRAVAEYGQEAAWLLVILGSIPAFLSVWLLTRLQLRFPQLSMIGYGRQILGSKNKKPTIITSILLIPALLPFLSFWLVGTAAVARTFGEVVVTAVLRKTPLEVTIFSMLLVAALLVIYEVEVIARVNEILLPLIIVPILFLAIFSLQRFELENLLPVWPNIPLGALFSGVLITVFAYQGYEILTLYSRYTQVSSKNVRMNLLGVGLATFTYTLIVFAGVSVFGDEELALLMWPTLELVKVTQVPGLILERMESAFLGVWVVAVFTTTANLYHATSLLISEFFNLEKYRRWLAGALLPLLFWLALRPQNVIQLFEWQRYIGYVGVVAAFVFPLLFFIIAHIRKVGLPYQELLKQEEQDQSKSSESDYTLNKN